MELTLPASIVLWPHVPDHNTAVSGPGEGKERDPALLVGRTLGGETVGGAVWGSPETCVERLVGVADQGGVGVGILH